MKRIIMFEICAFILVGLLGCNNSSNIQNPSEIKTATNTENNNVSNSEDINSKNDSKKELNKDDYKEADFNKIANGECAGENVFEKGIVTNIDNEGLLYVMPTFTLKVEDKGAIYTIVMTSKNENLQEGKEAIVYGFVNEETVLGLPSIITISNEDIELN